jgi:hypothetical protein
MVFTSDPWAVIESAVSERSTVGSERDSALSFVRQAREYHLAADTARSTEAQPLLYYYGFLNLAKALAIATGRPGIVGRVEHGLRVEDLSASLANAEITAYETGRQRQGQSAVNAYDEFNLALTGSGLTAPTTFPVSELMAQVLFGHRLWVEAARRRERFIGIERIEFRHIKDQGQVWVNIVVPEGALVWRGRAKEEVLEKGGLKGEFDFVWGAIDEGGTPFRVFQQSTPLTYGARPSDDLMSLVNEVKPKLWRANTSAHPFRRYYLYLSENAEKRLPQLLSIYLLMFYLGSITRYNPPLFRVLLDGRYGAFFRESLSSQPQQFVYGIACEFRLQEVSRAAVV